MKEWILSICAVVILVEIICIILPEEKNGKLIKNLFSIFIIFVILQPILDYSLYDFEFNNSNDSSVIYQEDYLSFVSEKQVENVNLDISRILSSIGIDNAEISTNYEILNQSKIVIKKVEVNLKNAVIISNKEHIDIIEEAKEKISKYLTIEKGAVCFYDG